MKISNIRKEEKDGRAFLTADFSCSFSKGKTLWFAIDSKYSDWLTTDVYDAFLVEAVYMAMYYGEDIVIDGPVSKRLYKNLTEYMMPFIKSLKTDFKLVNVKVKGYKEAEKNGLNIVGTGFSGGVDSFSTIICRFENEQDPEYKINSLFFFNLGQYPGKTAEDRYINAKEHYINSKAFADEVGLPFIFLDSNMFDYYLPEWEYDAGTLCRISAILALQRAITKYYIAGSYHYIQQNTSQAKHLDDIGDSFIYYVVSSANTEIILDGGQFYRSDKIVQLSDYSPAHRHLNVCVNPNLDLSKEKNCSVCHKCMRTLIDIDSIGKLENFKDIFDLDKYKSVLWKTKCRIVLYKEKESFTMGNYKFAVAHGQKFPSKFAAWLYLLPNRVKSRLFKK